MKYTQLITRKVLTQHKLSQVLAGIMLHILEILYKSVFLLKINLTLKDTSTYLLMFYKKIDMKNNLYYKNVTIV